MDNKQIDFWTEKCREDLQLKEVADPLVKDIIMWTVRVMSDKYKLIT